MKADEQEPYMILAKSRKACRLCNGLINPSMYSGGVFDTAHIGPWSQWQGNLDARLLIVGQDWGDTSYFEKYKGRDIDNNPSNKTLRELLASIGIEIDPPSAAEHSHESVFLTNAILCLKDGGLGAPVKSSWFNNCGRHFLRPTIDIVSPKVVVSLGKHAFESIRQLYDLPKMLFRNAVDQPAGFVYPTGYSSFLCIIAVHEFFTRIEKWSSKRQTGNESRWRYSCHAAQPVVARDRLPRRESEVRVVEVDSPACGG